MRKLIRQRFLFVCIFLVIFLVIVAGYFYKKNISYKNPELTEQTEAEALAGKVGRLVFLPQDEIPTIATVSNPEVLKDQVFFTEAKKGDVVLIYTNAKKAVLYDPVANKIRNMSTVNISTAKKATAVPSTVTGGELTLPGSSTPGQF